MATDPYTLLGVSRTASEAEIKKAYHKLAKKYHPDMNPGRKDIEQKFKEVNAAYDLLSDSAKRARFDAGEIDAQGNERGFSYGHYGGGPHGAYRSTHTRGRSGPFGFGAGGINPEDIFAEFFGGGKSRGFDPHEMQRGANVSYEITIPFVEACLGGKKRVTLSGNKTIDVNIPPGTEDGHKLRLRGLGQAGHGGTGDAIVEIKVAPHAFFRREGIHILLDVPVSLPESVLGSTITVPTLHGPVALKIPKGANTDTSLRLKGKGVPQAKGPAGDMLVKLKVMLPDNGDLTGLEKWAQKNAYDPRKKLGWGV